MTESKKNTKKEESNQEQASSAHNYNDTYKSSGNPAMDMFKSFAQQGKTAMDRDTMVNKHRKNLDAMNDASKTAMDLLKSVTNLQNQYARQAFEEFNTMLRDMVQTPQTSEQLKKQASRLKESMTKAMDHTSNVANIVVKTNSDFYKKAQNHAKDAFQEMKFTAMAKKR
ncbi:MAG: phasin family protein [Pseudomonadota bacterium]